MSRSRRKTRITGITCKESEKKDKRIANRKLRRKTKRILNDTPVEDLENEELPDLKEISDVWLFAKDGKQYLSDKEENEKYLRK